MKKLVIFTNTVNALKAALGFRAHSGWAMLVALAGPVEAPSVMLRRHLDLADRRIGGSVQPYHAAAGRDLDGARTFLDTCATATRGLAQTAVRDAVAALADRGYRVEGCCVLVGSGRSTTDLRAILASHPMIHTAEGEFYREALRNACESCGLAVTVVREKEVLSCTAARRAISVEHLQSRLTAIGKSIGRPWTQDEKLSALAAWVVMGW